jgi:hypothetical protein
MKDVDIVPVHGRAIATCNRPNDGCRTRTLLTGLLYCISLEGKKRKTEAVRSCPSCNRYFNSNQMEAVQ